MVEKITDGIEMTLFGSHKKDVDFFVFVLFFLKEKQRNTDRIQVKET